MPGNQGYTPKLVKYDIKTGEVVELVIFEPGGCDPHDIAIHNGVFYGVNAGEHPGWLIDNPAYQRAGWRASRSTVRLAAMYSASTSFEPSAKIAKYAIGRIENFRHSQCVLIKMHYRISSF